MGRLYLGEAREGVSSHFFRTFARMGLLAAEEEMGECRDDEGVVDQAVLDQAGDIFKRYKTNGDFLKAVKLLR